MAKSVVHPNQIRIVEVLSSSDLNPKYLDCVPLYITSWLSIPIKKHVKFLPKVLIVASEIPDSLSKYSEYLQLLDPQDMPTAFVAQTSRIVQAKNSIADFVMTSDIDMLPLSVNFETNIIDSEKFNLDSFFILRDVLEPGQFPICYNLAKPSVWSSLINRYGSGETTQKNLRVILDEFGGNSAYSGLHGGKGWTIDQQVLWNLVQDSVRQISFKRFTDHESGHRRLDRIHHRGLLKWLILPFVFFGFFHDYHVHHPVDLNRKYINMVIRVRNLGLGKNKL